MDQGGQAAGIMGLFGKRKFPDDGEPQVPSAEDIKKLVPFAKLNPKQLHQVAEAALFERIPGGPINTGDPEGLVFLHRGRAAVETQGQPRQLLSSDLPASEFALPRGRGLRVHALTPCTLLKIPSRFLVLAGGKLAPKHPIDWRESDTGEQPLLNFYYDIKNGNCELPSMPDLATRIGKVIDDPSTASERIARVIQSDPALATRVMSVVNSASYNTGQPIQNLSQAVSRLGREHIRNLVFSFIVKGMFRTDCTKLKKRMAALWAHSCHVGAIAAILAKHTPGLDPERALLAGLVHDVGIIPILDRAREHPEVLDDPEVLDRLIDQLRDEIGVQTMRHWGFDQQFIDIAARAEDWQRPGDAIPDYVDVVILAQLHAYIGTSRMAELPRIDEVPAFRKLAGGTLTPRGSMMIIDNASREIEELRRLLSAG